MPLRELQIHASKVTDLTPLNGMPLTNLYCGLNTIADLSPLKGLKLQRLVFQAAHVVKGWEVLREMNTLKILDDSGTLPGKETTPAEFWKRLEAGEFKAPGGKGASSTNWRPILSQADAAYAENRFDETLKFYDTALAGLEQDQTTDVTILQTMKAAMQKHRGLATFIPQRDRLPVDQQVEVLHTKLRELYAAS